MSFTYTFYAFDHPENSRKQKVLVAAAFAGLNVEFKPATMPPTEEFKRDFSPMGGSPVLVTPNGPIFETNSVLRYIARNDKAGTLYGKNSYENSLVDAWMDLSLSELDIMGMHVVNAVIFGGTMPSDWLESMSAVLQAIEGRLNDRTFLVGEGMTIADICIAFTLQIPYRLSGFGKELSQKFPNVWRMYSAVMQQETTSKVLKEIGSSWGLIEAPATDAAEKQE